MWSVKKAERGGRKAARQSCGERWATRRKKTKRVRAEWGVGRDCVSWGGGASSGTGRGGGWAECEEGGTGRPEGGAPVVWCEVGHTAQKNQKGAGGVGRGA